MFVSEEFYLNTGDLLDDFFQVVSCKYKDVCCHKHLGK